MLARAAIWTLTVVFALCLSLAMVLWHTGVLFVELEERQPSGRHLYLPIPVLLVRTGLALMPSGQAGELCQALAGREKAIAAFCEELAKCSDAALLELDSSEAKMRIAKQGAYLVLLVDSRQELVRVSIPIDAIRTLALEGTGSW